MSIKALLAVLTLFNFIAWIFVIIATAVTDWTKSSIAEYGIWNICAFITGQDKQCYRWVLTENSSEKDCEGALTATRAFSVLSIIFGFFTLLISLALMASPTLIKKSTVLLNLCMVMITDLWFFLGWIMYLGVEARGHCAINDYTAHLGSSWFLQLFAWIIGFLACIPLALLIYLKWKKTPRFCGQAPYVAGPAPSPACPAPYGPGSNMYPQPYPGMPAPYAGSEPNKAPYYPYGPGTYPVPTGPTPTTSPYMPTPYW